MLFSLFATAAAAALSEAQYGAEFASFMASYNKVYSHDELRSKYETFKANFDFVAGHDAEAAGFTVGINSFADLSSAEFSRLYKGLAPLKQQSAPNTFVADENVDLPATVDWRQKGAVTGIKNQGQCGSCWSFSATGSMEGQHFLSGQGSLVGLSEQNLVDCSTAQGNQGCNGGLMDDAFQYVISNNGIDSESSYPYTATGPNQCQFNSANVATTIDSYTDVTSGSESDLQQAAATIGPVSVAIDASHQSFQFYTGGVYNEPDCSSSQLDHGVLVVGYGTDNGTPYWLVKNSWGTDWGMSGYIEMSRNANNQCGIATAASFPVINSRK